MIKPKALQAGDKVAVIAPASPFEWKALETGVAALRSLGLEVELPPDLGATKRYLAGEDAIRLEQLHRAFSDKSIKGIFCARGGYGSMRLISGLKPELIAQDPKVFVGYSDLTALLMTFTTNFSLVTFHGPVVAKELDAAERPQTLEWLKNAVMSTKPLGELSPQTMNGSEPVVISPGTARGILTGGNLTLVSATLGTSFEIQTDGKILFLEERGERPYRVDRLLHHLKLAKKFNRVAGILLGEFLDCGEPGDSRDPQEQILEVLREVFADVTVPILYGFPSGHGKEKYTLPFGVSAVLEADRGILRITESATV